MRRWKQVQYSRSSENKIRQADPKRPRGHLKFEAIFLKLKLLKRRRVEICGARHKRL